MYIGGIDNLFIKVAPFDSFKCIEQQWRGITVEVGVRVFLASEPEKR